MGGGGRVKSFESSQRENRTYPIHGEGTPTRFQIPGEGTSTRFQIPGEGTLKRVHVPGEGKVKSREEI